MEEKEMYNIELKRKWDRANILAHAREQGEAKGKAETEAKKNLEFVSNLLKDGRFTVEEIAKLANVPVAFVLKVRSEQNRTTK